MSNGYHIIVIYETIVYSYKKEKAVSFCFYPTNSDISIVKVDATLSIRPTNSKVTTRKQFLNQAESSANLIGKPKRAKANQEAIGDLRFTY